MNGRLFIYPFKHQSKGARELKESLGVKFLRIQQERSRVRFRDGDAVINWGSAKCWAPADIVWNKPEAINKASNKLLFFAKAAETESFKTPLYTTDVDEARTWETCVARTKLRGHSGEGIVITNQGDDPAPAELYTRYIKKDQEWRIHVAFGTIIDCQRKIRDPDREPIDWKVRSHKNGFIYARESGVPSNAIKRAATAALRHFDLDFAAADIITTKAGNPYVLELNTAPGLMNTTLEKYSEAFAKRYNPDDVA